MPDNKLKTELLYFDDCSSWRNAQEILRESLSKLGLPPVVELIPVETQKEAVQYKFTGSPMIRVNGEDIFPTDQENYALGCRVYQTPEGLKGWPTGEMVTEKLQTLIHQD